MRKIRNEPVGHIIMITKMKESVVEVGRTVCPSICTFIIRDTVVCLEDIFDCLSACARHATTNT
jgi:hypothetical protein